MNQSVDVVYQGSTKVICESITKVKPPMSKIVGEKFDAKVTHYITFCDKVLVKGIIEKTVLYLHPHFHHQKDDQCQKDDGKNKKRDHNEKGNNKDGKQKGCQDECKKDIIDYKKFACKRVDYQEGIVHFFEDTYEFTAVINVPGVKAGDICKFNVFDVKVKDVSDFFVMDRDKKGLVTKGKEFFLLDVRIKCKSKSHK
ncbi:hypothetical protein JCM14036_33480 [Desulfotomaculum defluvii]